MINGRFFFCLFFVFLFDLFFCLFFIAVKPVLPRPALLFFSGLHLRSGVFRLFLGFFYGNSWWFLVVRNLHEFTVFTGQQGAFVMAGYNLPLNETAPPFLLLLFNQNVFLWFLILYSFFFKEYFCYCIINYFFIWRLKILYKQHF